MTQLNEEHIILKERRIKAHDEWRKSCNLYDTNEMNRRRIHNEIAKFKELEHSEAILKQISEIENNNVLSESDKQLIIVKADKTIYTTDQFTFPRYIDLVQLTKFIINAKLKYPNWTLTKITRYGQLESYPPQSLFKLTFKTEHNDVITLNDGNPYGFELEEQSISSQT